MSKDDRVFKSREEAEVVLRKYQGRSPLTQRLQVVSHQGDFIVRLRLPDSKKELGHIVMDRTGWLCRLRVDG